MASITEQIAARIVVVAAGVPALLGIYRDRQDAITREESPVLLVEIVEEESMPLGGARGPFTPAGAVEQSTVRVACAVCVRNANWQSVADDARVALHALLLADAPLRALAPSIRRDRCEWKPAGAGPTDLPFGYAAQIYEFKTLVRAHAIDALAA